MEKRLIKIRRNDCTSLLNVVPYPHVVLVPSEALRLSRLQFELVNMVYEEEEVAPVPLS